MRTISLVLFAAVAAGAQASFELGLLVTSGSNSILRVDPENRLVMGSFGASRLLNPRAVVIDQSNSEALVLNEYSSTVARITVFNYNTGSFVREFGLGFTTNFNDLERTENGDLLVPNGNSIRRFSRTGTPIRTYTSAGSNFQSVSYSQAYGEVYGHDFNTGGGVVFNAPNGTFEGVLLSGNSVRGANASANFSATFGGDTQVLRKFDHVSLSWASTSTTEMNFIQSTSFGHGNTVYAVGVGVAGQSTIVTFDSSLNRLSSAWNIPGTGILSMATVLAPEPGSIIALGIGALFLSRRKRSCR